MEREFIPDLGSDPVFLGLARPPMFAGVPAGFFIVLMIFVGEGVFVFKHWAVFVVGALIYGAGLAAAVRDPNIFHVHAMRWLKCPPQRDAHAWGGASYRP